MPSMRGMPKGWNLLPSIEVSPRCGTAGQPASRLDNVKAGLGHDYADQALVGLPELVYWLV